MATVTRSSIGNLHDKLTVKITKDDYLASFEKALKNYGKNANIPGFRKGNVPTGMIKKMYGPSIFADEVLRTANKELEQYLQTEKPVIFAQPLAMPIEKFELDVHNPSDYEFAFEIGLKPEFEVTPLNNKGSISKYNITIDDKLVDLEIENIKRRAGQVENPEFLEEATDIVYATYQIDGNEELFEDVITLEKTPAKLQEVLKGQKADFTYKFNVKETLTAEELAEIAKSVFKKEAAEIENADLTLTLTKVGRLIPRELDATLFAEVFPTNAVETEAEFRELLKAEIAKEGQRLTNERLQNDIFETLVHQTPIELPTAFLKNWIKRGGEKEKTDEEVEAEYPGFEHQLLWTLISDKLIREYDIKVSYEEVVADLKTKVMAYFGTGNDGEEPEWMAEYLNKMAQDQNTLDEAYRRLLFDQLFAKIAEVAEVAEKEVTGEEFAQIPSVHQHNH